VISPQTDGRLVPQSLDVTDYLDPPHDDHRGDGDFGRDRPAVHYPLVARTEDDPGTSHILAPILMAVVIGILSVAEAEHLISR
jgi:hypothetical protein